MSTIGSLATQAVWVVADKEPAQGPEYGKASPVGLLMVVLLLIATFLLIRSMNKQLRKLPASFDSAHPEADQAFDEGTDSIDDDVEDAPGADDGTARSAAGGKRTDDAESPG